MLKIIIYDIRSKESNNSSYRNLDKLFVSKKRIGSLNKPFLNIFAWYIESRTGLITTGIIKELKKGLNVW